MFLKEQKLVSTVTRGAKVHLRKLFVLFLLRLVDAGATFTLISMIAANATFYSCTD